MDYELAILIKNKYLLNKIQTALEHIFADSDIVKADEILNAFKEMTIDSNTAESVIYILMNNSILIKEKSNKRINSYYFTINDSEYKTYFIEQEKYSLATIQTLPPLSKNLSELVITYPNDNKFERVHGLKLLYPSLKRMIKQSKQNIDIINPFFDAEGTEKVLIELISAAQRGVKINIVTREYSTSKNLTQCINRIIQCFKEKELTSLISIRNYYVKTGSTFYSIHSKIIIVDNNKCYIGSANLTSSSMSSNLELGVILENNDVKTVKRIFNNLWSVAEHVK